MQETTSHRLVSKEDSIIVKISQDPANTITCTADGNNETTEVRSTTVISVVYEIFNIVTNLKFYLRKSKFE